MEINRQIFAEIKEANAQVIVVSKYLNSDETAKILELSQKESAFWALGENRIETIPQKNIPKEFCHFIGNLQSRCLKDIAEHCSVIHSLDNLKHAERLTELPDPPAVFLQINVSKEAQKGGIFPENFAEFVQKIPKKLQVLGISALGAREASVEQKRAEFATLKQIRDANNKGWKISAGTSSDYQIALAENIDIVRIGKAFWA